MRQQLFLLIVLVIALFPATINAQAFAGTDDLGRVLPLNEHVGNLKANKQVAIFYFLWQGDSRSKVSENYWDLSEIVPNHPEVLEDFDNHYWGSREAGRFYFWGKPIYGYYRGDDYWVHLRSIQLLTDAGVDVLVIDATNRFIYAEQAESLMRAIDTVRAQGKNAPKIAFYTNTASGETMQKAYDKFYKAGAPFCHPDTWFYLDGKPLIIGKTAEASGKNYEHFFTYRESQWPNEAQKINGWPWIEFERPQKVYYNENGQREIVNVSIAQHPNWQIGMGGAAFYGNRDNWGRSYRNGNHGDPATDIAHGYNFQEQWDFVLKQDVPFVFITGWNEWVAGRWKIKDGGNPEHSTFVDLASPEYSRDAEPSLTGRIGDNYYMQMVSNIRKYKGIKANLAMGPEKTIHRFNDWDDVTPVYDDYVYDVQPRDHPGAQSKPAKTYTNYTGRNDFHLLKVARDKRDIFFYAATKETITENSGSNWMTLYLDADRSAATGWKGYDYRIAAGNNLQKYNGVSWEDLKRTKYAVNGNQMMIAVPRRYIANFSGPLNFEFKWSDNMQNDDPLDWYVNGDVAPGGRFNYIVNE